MIPSRLVRAAGLAAAWAGLAIAMPPRATAQGIPDVRQQAREVSSESIAAQLGTKLAPGQAEELGVGTSLTGSLTDSTKLAALGAPGLHTGARVTMIRISNDRVRIEADELDPVPLTRKLTVRIDAQGRLHPLTP